MLKTKTPKRKLSLADRAQARYIQAEKDKSFRDSLRQILSDDEREQLETAQYYVEKGYIVHNTALRRVFPVQGAHEKGQSTTAANDVSQAAVQGREASASPQPRQRRGDAEGAAPASLPPAKSRSRFREVTDEKTGEIQRFTYDEKKHEFVAEYDPHEALAERFMLQSVSRNILKAHTKENGDGRPVPRYRVCDCHRLHASGVSDIAVVSSTKTDSVRYKGVQTCGSVWQCPVCAARVSEVRKLEVRQAVDMHMEQGGGVLFLTFTFPHSKNDDLRELLGNFVGEGSAWDHFCHHRAVKKQRKALGYSGRIRALEVTWSPVNGWHVHIHEIWFVERPLKLKKDREAVKAALIQPWQASCVNSGFRKPTVKHGMSVDGAESAADYIAKFGTEPKWELAKEMTKSHTKKSRSRKGKTPFDLLRDAGEGKEWAAGLFEEYAIAFHGKRQLYWSPKLKARFQIEELEDEEIADHIEDDAVVLAQIALPDWKLVVRFAGRALVITLARNGGADAVERYLSSLRQLSERKAAIPGVDFGPE